MTTLGSLLSTDGIIRSQTSYTSADFVKTSSSALTQITGLSLTLTTGSSYYFRINGTGDFPTTPGYKFGVDGTCSISSLRVGVTTNYLFGSQNGGVGHITALGGSYGAAGNTGSPYNFFIDGFVTCSTGGTFYPTFAQNASNISSSTVYAGAVLYSIDLT